MERIKKAVDRARAQREGFVAESRQMATGGFNAKIEYSQTKVVSADEEVLRQNRLLTAIDSEDIRAAYRVLRTHCEQRMSSKGWNACAVTSPVENTGKTTIAINLAISLAWEMHKTVLLADLDFRRPMVAARFGISESKGLIDYLTEGHQISDSLINPGIERLVLLPAGNPTRSSSELLASPRMSSLVSELKTRYSDRIIIFNLPPLLAGDDALAFLPNADCALLVVEDSNTERVELSEAIELIANTSLLGICLNNTEGDALTSEEALQQ